jgi:ABC-2 type transport system ATP-binding protein
VAIEAQGLTKVFGRGSSALRAVDGLDLQIKSGEIFGFLGPNGAGKTTTIRMMTGIVPSTKGRAFLLGEEISPDHPRAKHDLGFMPEMPGFYPGMKAIDHMVYWGDLSGVNRREARRRATDLLSQVGLGEAATRKAKDFSHGMKKRLALAGALIAEPQVLILDEPSGGLDPEGTIFFRKLIESQAKAGKTIFLSSHLLPEVQLICTRVGIITQGKMVAVDTVDELALKVNASAPSRVQVTCPPLTAEQVALVQQVPGVQAVEPHPHGVVVTADVGTPLGFELNELLINAGVHVEALWPLLPSLEEVFLHLIQQSTGGESS